MTIELGRGRGFMQPGGQMKVYIPELRESMWAKVVAIHKSKFNAIGILMNNPFSKGLYTWGDFVRIEEKKPNEIAHIVGHASKVPNNKNWQILER